MPTGVDLAWASSNENVAIVDAGNVTGVAEGECVITASFEYDGAVYSDTCNVTVSGGIEPGITLNVEELTLEVGEEFQFVVTTVPENTPFELWLEGDSLPSTLPGTLTPDGLFTATNPDICTLVAEMSYEGTTYDATCNITVIPAGEKVIGNFISDAVWNDEEKWVSKEYTATDRKTYVTHYSDTLNLNYNPEGSNSSLFLDIRPVKDIFGAVNLDEYDYSLRIDMQGLDFYTPSDEITVLITTGGVSDNLFKIAQVSEVFNYESAYSLDIPLIPNNPDGTRFMTLQMKVINTQPMDYVSIEITKAEVVRISKE